MSTRLVGQTALVTGGSRGIGRAICQRLDALGARVIVHYAHDDAAAQATLRTMTQPGAQLLKADLGSTAAVTEAVARLDAERTSCSPSVCADSSDSRRLGTAGDVAQLVVVLCGDERPFVTGQSINVSGGFVI